MYSPAHFVEDRIGVMHDLITAHRLATIVHNGPDGLTANHIPLLIDPTRGASGTLVGHIARANPLWQEAAGQSILIVFQGPQAYVSPSWYPSKQIHGKVVPTWNYAVVHAQGTLRAIDDPTWLLAHVATMTDANEANRTNPWKVGDAPHDYTQTLVKAIVGIEIDIVRLTGKWKVSQNRPADDRAGVVDGLTADGQNAMAALVKNADR